DLRKKNAKLCLASSTCHTRLGVRNDVRQVYQCRLEQGCQAKNDSGRVATRVTNHPGLTDGITVDLRKTVHGLLQHIWAGMWHLVPLLEHGQVTQTKVCCQVDDLDTGLQKLFGLVHGHTMGSGKENHIALFQR